MEYESRSCEPSMDTNELYFVLIVATKVLIVLQVFCFLFFSRTCARRFSCRSDWPARKNSSKYWPLTWLRRLKGVKMRNRKNGNTISESWGVFRSVLRWKRKIVEKYEHQSLNDMRVWRRRNKSDEACSGGKRGIGCLNVSAVYPTRSSFSSSFTSSSSSSCFTLSRSFERFSCFFFLSRSWSRTKKNIGKEKKSIWPRARSN